MLYRIKNYDAYNKRGVYKFLLKDISEALMDYKKAIMIKSDYAKGYYNLGVAYHEIEKCNLAISYYDKAIKLNSRYAEAYCNRGGSKAKSGDNKGAITDSPDYELMAYCGTNFGIFGFDTLNEAIVHVSGKMDIPIQRWIKNSAILKSQLYQTAAGPLSF